MFRYIRKDAITFRHPLGNRGEIRLSKKINVFTCAVVLISLQAMEKNKKKFNSTCRRLFVAAIDFGTTYSGFAFSQRSSWENVHFQTCSSGDFLSQKEPTVLLLNPDKSFKAFGYNAETTYMEMTKQRNLESDITSKEKPEENWKKYYYFSRFKMLLYENEVRVTTCKLILEFV